MRIGEAYEDNKQDSLTNRKIIMTAMMKIKTSDQIKSDLISMSYFLSLYTSEHFNFSVSLITVIIIFLFVRLSCLLSS